jgi:CRISPR-associated protein Csd2
MPPDVHTDPEKRHDFVLIFDVTDGNPNGDPDASNLPRTDPETMQGIVTDVALKRKVRNFVSLVAEDEENPERLKIFVEHRGVLNNQIRRAYTEQGMEVGKRVERQVEDAAVLANLREIAPTLPGAFAFTDADEEMEEPARLAYSGELSTDELKEALDAPGDALHRKTKSFVNALAKESGKPDKNRDNAEKARKWMCENFYDVRMFGAVMSTGLNAGQVRGPLQLTFARSVHPVLPQDLAVTRVAVTDEKDREKLQTIGRKTLVPYGLYVGYGFYSPHLGTGNKGTGVTEGDLRLFWDALVNMWAFDRSASRGMMTPRSLYVFTHERKLGNAPAHKLFDLVRSELKPELEDKGENPRKFSDYTVHAERNMPEGVTLTALVE